MDTANVTLAAFGWTELSGMVVQSSAVKSSVVSLNEITLPAIPGYKDFFGLDDKAYQQKLRETSIERLHDVLHAKTQAAVSAAVSIGNGIGLAPFTHGGSLVLVLDGGRRFTVANRKLEMTFDELEARGVVNAKQNWKDAVFPAVAGMAGMVASNVAGSLLAHFVTPSRLGEAGSALASVATTKTVSTGLAATTRIKPLLTGPAATTRIKPGCYRLGGTWYSECPNCYRCGATISGGIHYHCCDCADRDSGRLHMDICKACHDKGESCHCKKNKERAKIPGYKKQYKPMRKVQMALMSPGQTYQPGPALPCRHCKGMIQNDVYFHCSSCNPPGGLDICIGCYSRDKRCDDAENHTLRYSHQEEPVEPDPPPGYWERVQTMKDNFEAFDSYYDTSPAAGEYSASTAWSGYPDGGSEQDAGFYGVGDPGEPGNQIYEVGDGGNQNPDPGVGMSGYQYPVAYQNGQQFFTSEGTWGQ